MSISTDRWARLKIRFLTWKNVIGFVQLFTAIMFGAWQHSWYAGLFAFGALGLFTPEPPEIDRIASTDVSSVCRNSVTEAESRNARGI